MATQNQSPNPKERYFTNPDQNEDVSKRIISRFGAIFGVSSMALGGFALTVGAVTSARSHHLLEDWPQWANPIEHINNVPATLAINMPLFVIAGLGLFVADKSLTPKGVRAAAKGMLAVNLAFNAVGEMPATQPLVRETHLFSSSTPGFVDFLYGAAGSVLLARGFAGVLENRFSNESQLSQSTGGDALQFTPVNMPVGPADFDLVQHPGNYSSVFVR